MPSTDITFPELRSLILKRMENRVAPKQLAMAKAIQFPTTKKPWQRLLGTSTKVEKSRKVGMLTAVIYLAPSLESLAYGGINLCPFASAGCARACLGDKGRLYMARDAKAWKTLTWIYAPEIFKAILIQAVAHHEKEANKLGMECGIRLNGSSDVVWEKRFPSLFKMFPDVQWYDYTKIWQRFDRPLPKNYHLTFSRSEDVENQTHVIPLLRRGINVSIVFEDFDAVMRAGRWMGYEVTDGDVHDARPHDKRGVIVALSPKGRAKDDTGFFVPREETDRFFNHLKGRKAA